MWNINFIKKDIETYSTGYGTRAIHTKYIIDTPLIDYFAYDIWVPSTANIEGCNNIQVGWVKTCCKKLSDLIRETMPIIDNTKIVGNLKWLRQNEKEYKNICRY